jgi:hypothetical protein
MDLQHNSISPAANDITGSINFFGKDSGAANQEYARIYSVIADPTAASEDGILKLGVVTAGTVANELELTGAALYPTTNDGLALGTSALSYADLFLASSGVINFNNGNATLTHSAGLLTSNVDIAVPDEAYGVGWNGSLEVPTKNALYDKIETLTGITRSVVVTSGSATMGSAASTDYVYMVAGAHTMSLPAASGNTNRYTVKNNHSANITIDTVGAETVEGAASISIAPEESVDIISDGTNFRII